MLKYCIKTHLVHKQNFELSAKIMLLKFHICVFKAVKCQSSEWKSHVNVSVFGARALGKVRGEALQFTVMHFHHTHRAKLHLHTRILKPH